MSKPTEKRPVSYDAEVWARKKYGPTLKQAKTIISSSGPPKRSSNVWRCRIHSRLK